MTTVQQAAKHFLDLYADEVAAGQTITADAIYEWWGQTKEQYDGVEYEEVEKAIFAQI